MSKRKQNLLTAGIIFCVIAGLFMVIQACSGLYPFGGPSNLLWDEDVQYVDYFAFYKDVLLGKASLAYSFSKSAGGSLVALFGYYLGCPLNLLVVFFDKSQLPMFIFLLTAVKLGLCGVTINIFIKERFDNLSVLMRVMLSVAYGLMQYNILQLSNIMWLDGVILLPLLLLGVYRYVQQEKKFALFFMVLLSIAINWYTGYMTGLFAVLYYLYERILKWEVFSWKECRRFIIDTIKCGYLMVAGLLGSCFIFYPVFKGLQKGKTVFDPSIFSFAAYDSFIDVFKGFALGSIVPTAALYCGILFLGFFFYYFVSGQVKMKEKILSVLAVLFMFASCWLVPLDCIWSGMRYAGTYRFRYSFVVIFLVLYLAARGAQEYEKRRDCKKMVWIFAGCMAMFLFFQYKNPYEKKNFILTLICVAVYAILFLFAEKKKYFKPVLCGILAAELVANGVLTFVVNYWERDVSVYQEYVVQSEKQISSIKEKEEAEFYRMDTLQKRNDAGTGCSAYLNEAMVYGYRGLNHYSSTFDTDISRFLYDVGYSTLLDLSVYQESILPSDSLMGIKYLLSNREVPGYVKEEEIPEANGKSVYYNPYALGLGMEADGRIFDEIETGDPFEFQNQLFSNLIGRDVEIFRKAEYTEKIENNALVFWFPAMDEEDLLYGYVDSWITELQLYIDGEYRCDYATWLSYKVFSVGKGNQEHYLYLSNYGGTENEAFPYFYYLDQDVFESVIQELREKEVQVQAFEDGYVKAGYSAQEDGQILLTIPYDDGWKAYVNGEETEILTGANALSVIPVEKGENAIELKYRIPGMKTGVFLTIAGIFMFGALCLGEKCIGKKSRKKK